MPGVIALHKINRVPAFDLFLQQCKGIQGFFRSSAVSAFGAGFHKPDRSRHRSKSFAQIFGVRQKAVVVFFRIHKAHTLFPVSAHKLQIIFHIRGIFFPGIGNSKIEFSGNDSVVSDSGSTPGNGVQNSSAACKKIVELVGVSADPALKAHHPAFAGLVKRKDLIADDIDKVRLSVPIAGKIINMSSPRLIVAVKGKTRTVVEQ